jgi:hypothetical protein
MHARLRTSFTILLICAELLATTDTAIARTPRPDSSVFLTNNPNKLLGISLGLAAAGAGIGLGVYFVVHHKHNLTGCAATTADGLNLVTDGDKQTYALFGEIAGIKSGERVRVSGNRNTKDATGLRRFAVERLSKDFGACKVLPATP